MNAEVNLPVSQPKTSLTIPLLLILSIFSLVISGYLFWQNQKLQQQLALLQKPAPSPILTTSPSPDPTEGWKIITNNKYNFTFKYPKSFYIKTSDELGGTKPYSVFIYIDAAYQKLLLSFSFDQAKENRLDDFGEVKTTQPEELPVLFWNNQEYPTTKFLFGEGVPSYGNCMNSTTNIRYVAKMERFITELTRSKIVECNPDGTEKIIKEITDTEFETAKKILATFKFTQ